MSMKKQLAFLLARQQINFDTGSEELNEILCNTKLSENFQTLARDLDVVEAKTPEDIYKSHLENSRMFFFCFFFVLKLWILLLGEYACSGIAANVDSARQNLASTFVNAFVNAGFGSDKLMLNTEETNSWIYKNKDRGPNYFSPHLFFY